MHFVFNHNPYSLETSLGMMGMHGKYCANLTIANADVIFAIGEPDVYTIMNVAKNPIESGFKGMITLTNLCEDNLESLSVHIPEKWSDASELIHLT